MPRNERNKTRKARLEKAAARKGVIRALEGVNKAALQEEGVVIKNGKEEALEEGPVQQFILSKSPTLRLARIVSKESHTMFNIQFSEHGLTMQGQYKPRGARNFSRKQKTAAQKKIEAHLLPGPGTYVIVDWDEEEAARNKEKLNENKKHKVAAANIVAIIPNRSVAIQERAMKVANQAAKKAGKTKPWPVDSLFERENENENENENKSKNKKENDEE